MNLFTPRRRRKTDHRCSCSAFDGAVGGFVQECVSKQNPTTSCRPYRRRTGTRAAGNREVGGSAEDVSKQNPQELGEVLKGYLPEQNSTALLEAERKFEQIVDVLVRHVREETVEVVKSTSQERVPEIQRSCCDVDLETEPDFWRRLKELRCQYDELSREVGSAVLTEVSYRCLV